MGTLDSPAALKEELYPRWRRQSQCSRNCCRIFCHALIVLFLVALIIPFMTQEVFDINCLETQVTWLMIYVGIEVLHAAERTAVGVCWLYVKEPVNAEGRLFIFFRLWLIIGEAALIVYGNTFIFSEQIDECESESIAAGLSLTLTDMIDMLSWTATILIIYGYLLILYLICSCIFGIVLYKQYSSFCRMDATTKEILTKRD